MQTEQETLRSQVASGALVAVIILAVVVVGWHAGVIWPRYLLVLKSEFTHGYVVAPAELPDKNHIVSFDAVAVPQRIAGWGRVLVFPVTEQWVATLEYRTATGTRTTKVWEFTTACDGKTQEFLTLDRVHDINLMKTADDITASPPRLPLKTVHIHGPAAPASQR